MSETISNPKNEGESYEVQSLAAARVKLGLDVPNEDDPVDFPEDDELYNFDDAAESIANRRGIARYQGSGEDRFVNVVGSHRAPDGREMLLGEIKGETTTSILDIDKVHFLETDDPDYLSALEQTGLASLKDTDKNDEPGVGATSNTMPAQAPRAPYLADSERTFIANSAGTTQESTATSLPDLSQEQATAAEKPDAAPETKRGESPTELARRDIRERYAGLPTEQIRELIQAEFFDSGRITQVPDRRGHKIDRGSDLDMKLYAEAKKMDRLSSEYARQRGNQKAQRAMNERRSDSEQSARAEAARQAIESIDPSEKVSFESFAKAGDDARVHALSEHWASKGYLEKTDNGYQIPASLKLDKGKFMAAESVLKLRQEAIGRLHPDQAPAARPGGAEADSERPSAFDRLSKYAPFDPEKGASVEMRLQTFESALREAGDDSDELGLVMGQVYRQGLMWRDRMATDPETGQQQHVPGGAVSEEVRAFYNRAYKHYEQVLNHTDQEREEADQVTSHITDRSQPWLRARAAMRERSHVAGEPAAAEQAGPAAVDQAGAPDATPKNDADAPTDVISQADVGKVADYGELVKRRDQLRAQLPKPGSLSARMSVLRGAIGATPAVYRELAEVEQRLKSAATEAGSGAAGAGFTPASNERRRELLRKNYGFDDQTTGRELLRMKAELQAKVTRIPLGGGDYAAPDRLKALVGRESNDERLRRIEREIRRRGSLRSESASDKAA